MEKAPNTLEELLAGITPEIHQKLKQAVELGRWENGDRLSPEQVGFCLQAVIAYDELHLPEQEKVGFIDRTRLDKKECDY